MILSEAESVVGAMLAPLTIDGFFESVRASTPTEQAGSASHPRAALLGTDPEATVLAAFATHASILDCHAIAPSGPPPGPGAVVDAAAFRALIGAYHDRGYTVRIPEVRALAAPLLTFTRALEVLLCQPVEVSAFWSRAGARAKIHYDNNDNITVQLVGRKRWYVSADPAGLQNAWLQVGEPLPHLERHKVTDAAPGDLIYIPRGTPHSVESTTDSLHISILFTPLTVRTAIMAALDHLSDVARPLRSTAAARVAGVKGHGAALGPGIVVGLETLIAQCRDPAFIEAALAKRASLTIGKLERLTPVVTAAPLNPASRVRHALLSTAYLRDTGSVVDLALPGGHISIHAGAARALAFVAATPDFAIRDLPDLAPEVSVALVERLVAAGWLEPSS
jgi:bifunctional lysine-specific demethylase and histidyl-hydroxylase MINA